MKHSKEKVERAISTSDNVINGLLETIIGKVTGIKEEVEIIKEGKVRRSTILRAAFEEREKEISVYERAYKLYKKCACDDRYCVGEGRCFDSALKQARKEMEEMEEKDEKD